MKKVYICPTNKVKDVKIASYILVASRKGASLDYSDATTNSVRNMTDGDSDKNYYGEGTFQGIGVNNNTGSGQIWGDGNDFM